MKKVAFRHVPFNTIQQNTLTKLIEQAGYEAIWLSADDEIPTNCEVLMGYYPPAILSQMTCLKWLQIPAAGAERYCSASYASDDVILTNCSGAFGIAIAEYMVTGILMLLRQMKVYQTQQQKHEWRYAGACGSIYGSTVTVIGTGNLGTSFAERMKALGAHVRGVRRSQAKGPACFDQMFTTDLILDAVSDADIVAVCLPGTAETTNLIDTSVINALKPSAIFCNTGRGYTVDQDALMLALQENRIGGAVLDVFKTEPLSEDSPLWDMPNVIVTPHISGHDIDPINSEFIYQIFYHNLQAYFSGSLLQHIVDRKRGY